MASSVPTPCPRCGRTYSQGELFCPFDRSPLTPEAANHDPMIDAKINGRYTIQKRLGEGGMGVVYRAIQHDLDRPVAIKILAPKYGDDPQAAERFKVEAKAASQLTSGHTVVVHEFGAMEDRSLYIVMQLVVGESLRDRMQRGPIPMRDAALIAAQVAESLSEAHSHRPPIIHRDIKPDNVIVRTNAGGEPHATVLDFGLARFADSQRVRLTTTKSIIGTPAYMSPEQCRGDADIGPPTDLYSLGVMLYEMLAGGPPFAAADTTQALFKHVYEAPLPLREGRPLLASLPEALEALVMQMLEKEAAHRPASAGEVRSRLMAMHAQLPAVGAIENSATVTGLHAAPVNSGAPRLTPKISDATATGLRPKSKDTGPRPLMAGAAPSAPTPTPVQVLTPRPVEQPDAHRTVSYERPARRTIMPALIGAVLAMIAMAATYLILLPKPAARREAATTPARTAGVLAARPPAAPPPDPTPGPAVVPAPAPSPGPAPAIQGAVTAAAPAVPVTTAAAPVPTPVEQPAAKAAAPASDDAVAKTSSKKSGKHKTDSDEHDYHEDIDIQ